MKTHSSFLLLLVVKILI